MKMSNTVFSSSVIRRLISQEQVGKIAKRIQELEKQVEDLKKENATLKEALEGEKE